MHAALKAGSGPEVVLHYMSPESATVTHVRGIILSNATDNLRAWGVYERYLELLPRDKHELIAGAIASSWVPVDLVKAHYEVGEQLEISDEQVKKVAAQMAQRIGETFLGTILRAARSMGVESTGAFLKQNDRTWQRLYRGGGCTVLQLGPKEMILEDHGNPLIAFPRFRMAYQAYMSTLVGFLSKSAYVKQVRAREPHPHCLATRFSWV